MGAPFIVKFAAGAAVAGTAIAVGTHDSRSVGIGIQYGPVQLGCIKPGDIPFQFKISNPGQTPIRVQFTAQGGGLKTKWVTFTDPGVIQPGNLDVTVHAILRLPHGFPAGQLKGLVGATAIPQGLSPGGMHAGSQALTDLDGIVGTVGCRQA